MIDETRLEGRLASLEEKQHTLSRSVDELKEGVKDMHRLMLAVERMALQMESHTSLLDGIDRRLETVEKAPGRAYNKYREIFIGCVITAVAGAMIAALLRVIMR